MSPALRPAPTSHSDCVNFGTDRSSFSEHSFSTRLREIASRFASCPNKHRDALWHHAVVCGHPVGLVDGNCNNSLFLTNAFAGSKCLDLRGQSRFQKCSCRVLQHDQHLRRATTTGQESPMNPSRNGASLSLPRMRERASRNYHDHGSNHVPRSLSRAASISHRQRCACTTRRTDFPNFNRNSACDRPVHPPEHPWHL